MHNDKYYILGEMTRPFEAAILHFSELNVSAIYSYLNELHKERKEAGKSLNLVIMADEHLGNDELKLRTLRKVLILSNMKIASIMGENKEFWSNILNVPCFSGKPKINVNLENMKIRNAFILDISEKNKKTNKGQIIEQTLFNKNDENFSKDITDNQNKPDFENKKATKEKEERTLNTHEEKPQIKSEVSQEIKTSHVDNHSPLYLKGRIRTGQRIEHKGDVILEGSIHSGAEIFSNNNIHIYGECKGRLIAGHGGNKEASVYINNFDAEFIAISNVYHTFERNSRWKGKSVKISLKNNTIYIESLCSKKQVTLAA